MQHKNDYYTIGYIKTIYPTEEVGNGYKKREFVVRNIYRKRNKYFIQDIPFVATGDCIEQLDQVYPNLEVMVMFAIRTRPWIKDNVHQQKNGKDIYFTELSAWKVWSHTDKMAKEWVWEAKNFDAVNPDKEPIENTEPLKHSNKKEMNPDNKRYDHDKYSRSSDYSDPLEVDDIQSAALPDDDLPF